MESTNGRYETKSLKDALSEVAIHSNRPTFRELAIGLGLLRPLHAAERDDALRKCMAYLQYRMRSGSSMRSVLDHQLAVAVLERWLTL